MHYVDPDPIREETFAVLLCDGLARNVKKLVSGVFNETVLEDVLNRYQMSLFQEKPITLELNEILLLESVVLFLQNFKFDEIKKILKNKNFIFFNMGEESIFWDVLEERIQDQKIRYIRKEGRVPVEFKETCNEVFRSQEFFGYTVGNLLFFVNLLEDTFHYAAYLQRFDDDTILVFFKEGERRNLINLQDRRRIGVVDENIIQEIIPFHLQIYKDGKLKNPNEKKPVHVFESEGYSYYLHHIYGGYTLVNINNGEEYDLMSKYADMSENETLYIFDEDVWIDMSQMKGEAKLYGIKSKRIIKKRELKKNDNYIKLLLDDSVSSKKDYLRFTSSDKPKPASNKSGFQLRLLGKELLYLGKS